MLYLSLSFRFFRFVNNSVILQKNFKKKLLNILKSFEKKNYKEPQTFLILQVFVTSYFTNNIEKPLR